MSTSNSYEKFITQKVAEAEERSNVAYHNHEVLRRTVINELPTDKLQLVFDMMAAERELGWALDDRSYYYVKINEINEEKRKPFWKKLFRK